MKKIQTRLTALLFCICLIAVFFPVTAFAAQPTVTLGDVWRNTRTEIQVEFTSDTTGEYYFAVTDPAESTAAPNIDTSGAGTSCMANEKVTVTVSDVPTTSECTFWLVVKGEDGTVSEPAQTTIPEWDWWTLDEYGLLTLESDKGLTNWNNWLNSQDLYYQFYYKQSVTGVNIWKDVTNVEGESFPASEYPNLAAYTVEDGNTDYCAEDGVLYNASKKWLVAYPGGKTDTDFTVPDTVTSISSKAFYGNTKLKNVTANKVGIVSQAFAGSAIETFSANEIVRIADWSFNNCRKLTTVTVKGGESFYIDMYAFENCTSLTSFPFDMISDSGDYVFRGCSSLTEIQVPNRVNDSMFAGCTSLTKITVPDTVTFIGNYAFEGCTSLISVTFEGATPPTIFSTAFKPTQPAFRIHVPEGSEDAYIEELGEDFAPYILDNIQQYPLYVNGERIRSDNLTVACGDGTAAFDPAANTLTLTNAAITKYGGEYGYRGAINSGFENLTIVLVGDNTINTGGDSINTDVGCNLVITGDGTLTTNSHLDLGRSSGYGGNNDTGDLTIDGATVNVGTYLFVHHNITFENGAKVNVAGKITANHQSTVTLDGAATSVTADGIAMGNGSGSDQTESRLVINDGSLTLRDGVSFPNPEDGDTSKYSIHFDPKDQGIIQLNGGTFITESDCKVTNAPDENITVADTLAIYNGSWENGNLKIALHEHNLTLVPGKPATCTEDGTKEYYTCSVCNKAFEDENGTAEIKDVDTWKVIPAGHTPASDWSSDGENHWKICTVCHKEIEGTKAAHTSTGMNGATCQHKAVCDVCGAEYGDLAAHNPSTAWSGDETGHWHICQTEGCTEKLDFAAHTPDHKGHATEEYAIKCTECGYEIEAQLPHTHVFDREVATDAYKATDATCQAKAAYYKSCKCCEKGTETFEYGELGDHNFKWVIDKEATATEKGSKHEECTICGYKKEAVEIPVIGTTDDEKPSAGAPGDGKPAAGTSAESGKTDKTSSPRTGDNSNRIPWIAVLLVSGSFIGAASIRRKNKWARHK